MVPDPVAVWSSNAFIEEVRAWVAAQLAPRGIRLTGEWEQPHIRVWSSTIRFETAAGRVWFKVNGSGTAYEASLLALLGELCPGLAPEVLAHDSTRGWSLSRDAGPALRSIVGPEEMWRHWEGLLPRYAEAQLALAGYKSRFLITGVWELGPAQLPAQCRRLLAELAAKPIEEGGLTTEQAAALEHRLPTNDEWCAELGASPIPQSLQHDDLHSNNICWPGAPEDLWSARIIDWGDTSIGQPLGTMLSTLNSIAFHAGVLHDDGNITDTRVLGIRDAYLEPFTGLGSRDELVRWVALARSTASLTRALSWERALQDAPASVVAKHEFPVRAWMLELLESWVDVD